MSLKPSHVAPSRSGIDLPDFLVRPFSRLLGRRPLQGLGIHVSDDVLRYHFGSVAIGRSGVACQPPERWNVAKWPQNRIGVPHLVLLPIPGGAVGVALLRREPFGEHWLRVDPAQEILGRFLVLGV